MITWKPNRRITFNRWEECPRCGLDWPKKALRREPETGSVVCPECFDDPSHQDIKAREEPRTADTRQSSPWDPE
jgi:uncharacterized Zn finger protein (UPF0148 family)